MDGGELFLRFLNASLLEWSVLIVLIAVAAWSIFRIRAWYRDGEDPAASDNEMLSQLRDLHQQGDLSDEEYRSIKGRLVQRMNDSPRERDKRD